MTLLATLANAVQVLRATSRTAEAPVEAEPAIDTMALMSFEFAKAANAETIHRHEAALSRLGGVGFASAIAVLMSAFLGAVSGDSPEGGSPLFIASICIFLIVATGAALLRRFFRVSRLTLDHFAAVPGVEQWESMQRFIEGARGIEHSNHRRLSTVELGTDALMLLAALQVVLAAVWLIS